MELFKWEKISNTTHRAKVIGGWIVRDFHKRNEKISGFWDSEIKHYMTNALCFVADEKHCWNVEVLS